MKKLLLLVLLLALGCARAFATGEPSTKFNIFVPPNNEPIKRDVALIITAIYDSTHFSIIDDGADGDSDDTHAGMLMAGQSYVMYMRDGGINDDALYASGGKLKQDGDFFHITSDKNVFASQATTSDWQHDWAPSTNNTSLGSRFILYSPQTSNSKNDVNVFPYADSTFVTIRRISKSNTTQTGYTNVDMYNGTIVVQQMLNRGEDLIYKYSGGRDLFENGATYMIECSKPCTVQYGALYGDERDGGGYVPTSNGSSAGELMYFGVPFQGGTSGEQEMHIISWNDSNTIKLERFDKGKWTTMTTWTINQMKSTEWIGRDNGNVNYATTFRLTCTPGKKISVFEGNWFETGGSWSSDMATMISSDNGTCSGNKFLTYMARPSDEQRVLNPFTGKLFNDKLTHLYLFADNDTAHITIVDANTGGKQLKKTYTIAPNRYADFYMNVTDYNKIYNGTGYMSGPDRPYLMVTSDKNISIMNSNFNDNWMMYFGSAQKQSFKASSSSNKGYAKPGDTITMVTKVAFSSGSDVKGVNLEVKAESGLKVISSTFNDVTHKKSIKGNVVEDNDKTTVYYKGMPDLSSKCEYNVQHKMVTQINYNSGKVIPNNSVIGVETIVSGTCDGVHQQAVSSEGVTMNSANTSSMLFSAFTGTTFDKDTSDSWTCSSVDVNNDGYDDIFFTEKNGSGNTLYLNNKNGGFTKLVTGSLLKDKSPTVSNAWADVDNNGTLDLLTVNDTKNPCYLHMGDGKGGFKAVDGGDFTETVSYYQSAAFADYDNDGLVDIFISNYQPTRFNELFHNEGNGKFKKVEDGVISITRSESVGNTWADYNNDGYPDLLVLDNRLGKNKLYRNNKNGTFTLDSNSVIMKDGGYSVGSCWGDIDNDGDLDLFIANASKRGNYFYRNNGDGTFTKDTLSIISNEKGNSHGCSFVDINNDGWLDLYVTNDVGQKFIYLNDGKGNFKKQTNELVGADYGLSFGHAWADYDHDGDLDLFVAIHGNQPKKVFVNNTKNTTWISIKLVGTESNKSAIGARVYVKANKVWQMSEVNSQSGFGGQSSFRQHFGFGNANVIDSVKLMWPSGLVDYYTNVKVNQFITYTESSAQKISGIVYNDINGNCKLDSGESTIPYAQLTVNGRKIFADSKGAFSDELVAGKYALSVVSGNGVKTASCSSTGILVSKSAITNIMLPAYAVCQKPELGISMGFTSLRKGFKNKMKLSVVNKGESKSDYYTITLNVDPHVFITSASSTFNKNGTVAVNGSEFNSYTWKMAPLASGEEATIDLIDSVSKKVTVGDKAILMAELGNIKEDCDTTNNIIKVTDKFVGAIDPNDKYVSPAGDVNDDQELTYRIVFQNVGNAAASFAVITDELNPNLDMNTIKYLSTSHQAKISVVGRTITWKLDNLNLKDSTTSKDSSVGYVMFSIKPMKGSSCGSEITNTASIVFDYNDAIQTSTTHTQVIYPVKGNDPVTIFPNPAQDYTTVRVNGFSDNIVMKEISIYDYAGHRLKRIATSNTNKYLVNLSDLHSGIYFFHVLLEDGTVSKQQVVIE